MPVSRVWLTLPCCAALVAITFSHSLMANDADDAPAPIVREVADDAPAVEAPAPADDAWPLPPAEPAPLPMPRAQQVKPSPTPPPLDLTPDTEDLVGEVRLLAASKRFDEALSLLRTYRQRHPEDEMARRLELAIEVAHNEHRIRGMVIDQQHERMTVLADPDYLTAKAAAERPIVRRLDLVEVLVEQKRFPEAVNACNAILEDHPYEESVMSLKNAILRTMVEIERRRALRDRRTRHSEVLKEVIESGTMPRQPSPIPRHVLVFDEDLAEIERQAVRDRLDIRLDAISYENAPVGEVLRLLFAAAGMNYIILDEAISEQTVTMFLTDAPVSEVLSVLQNMVDVRFNYRGGTVYVTNSATPILITEIIRLASGLTNVQMSPQFETMTGSSSNGGGGGGSANPFGGDGGDDASDLERFLEQLPELVDWPSGSTYFVERKSNTLYVRSSPSTVAEVKRLLHALDFNNTQVLIEAKFVEVSEDALRELGVDWKFGGFVESGSRGTVTGGMQSGATGSGDLFTNLGVLANPGLSQAAAGMLEQGLSGAAVGPNSSGLAVGVIGAGTGMNPNFEASLRALEGRGKANTLSEPKILTLSNSTGLIDISQDISYVEDIVNRGVSTGGFEDDGAGTGTGNIVQNRINLPVPRFATESSGIRLRVVPSVARNSDIITLAIFPTVRELVRIRSQQVFNPQAGQAAGAAGINAVERPEFASRSLATALHVKNGQTVVLGGLISERSQEEQRGIPVLSRIPFAGALFRSESKRSERRKLLIFVTARIIDPSGAELSDEERWLRDTARVVLPPEVQRQLRQQERERQEDVEEMLQQQEDAEAARGETRRRPGDFRSRLQGGR